MPGGEAELSSTPDDLPDHINLSLVEDGSEGNPTGRFFSLIHYPFFSACFNKYMSSSGVPADVTAVTKEIGVQVDISNSQRSQPLSISKLIMMFGCFWRKASKGKERQEECHFQAERRTGA